MFRVLRHFIKLERTQYQFFKSTIDAILSFAKFAFCSVRLLRFYIILRICAIVVLQSCLCFICNSKFCFFVL